MTCQKCGNTEISANDKFCKMCETKINSVEVVVPFSSIEEVSEVESEMPLKTNKSIFSPVFSIEDEVSEAEAILAKGFPEWDLEPPMVLVRRRHQ